MPQKLQQQLQQLHNELAKNPPLSDEERASLTAMLHDIEGSLNAVTDNEQDASLVDGVNLAIERFEVSHPTVTATLRSILQSLANMGI